MPPPSNKPDIQRELKPWKVPLPKPMPGDPPQPDEGETQDDDDGIEPPPPARFAPEHMLEVLEAALERPQHGLASEGHLLRWQLRSAVFSTELLDELRWHYILRIDDGWFQLELW